MFPCFLWSPHRALSLASPAVAFLPPFLPSQTTGPPLCPSGERHLSFSHPSSSPRVVWTWGMDNLSWEGRGAQSQRHHRWVMRAPGQDARLWSPTWGSNCFTWSFKLFKTPFLHLFCTKFTRDLYRFIWYCHLKMLYGAAKTSTEQNGNTGLSAASLLSVRLAIRRQKETWISLRFFRFLSNLCCLVCHFVFIQVFSRSQFAVALLW